MDQSKESFSEDDFISLNSALIKLIKEHKDGISEYDLLKELQHQNQNSFSSLDFRNQLNLFQTHFLLFHSLYRLQQQLYTSGDGILEINPLNIILRPVSRENENSVGEFDALRDYYLDLVNLYETSDQDISELLMKFWRRLSANEQRESALAELGLKDPVEFETIKITYRKLAMQHHPDRGGNTQRFQVINAAMEILETGKNNKD